MYFRSIFQDVPVFTLGIATCILGILSDSLDAKLTVPKYFAIGSLFIFLTAT